MNATNLAILTNIIGAVESGGQIYGNRAYDAYAAKGENSSNEKTCTLGWAQNYGEEARKLCKMIFEKDSASFRAADKANIEQRLSQNWVSIGWNPTQAERASLIAIITTKTGKTCQDELFAQLMTAYCKNAETFGVTDTKAQMMWCEIEHLGGLTPVTRIFTRAAKPYTPESIYDSLLKDQNDTTNSNQVGDKKFQTRHQCCVKWINQYVTDTTQTNLWEKTKALLYEQVDYLEKASNYDLDSKTGNPGSANYTKYARDVNGWNQPGCQGQPWCAVMQFWIDVSIFGLAKALQHMGGGFYNCVSITNHAKVQGTWHTTPKLGALVIFRNGSHVGRVVDLPGTEVVTVEGNTSSKPGVVANGGAVREKTYDIQDDCIDGYVWIDYGVETETTSTETSSTLNTKPKWTGKVSIQKDSHLNVRSWAGAEYPNIKKRPTLSKGELVEVCASVKSSVGDVWRYVRIDKKYYGFVKATYLKKV